MSGRKTERPTGTLEITKYFKATPKASPGAAAPGDPRMGWTGGLKEEDVRGGWGGAAAALILLLEALQTPGNSVQLVLRKWGFNGMEFADAITPRDAGLMKLQLGALLHIRGGGGGEGGK
eukprot:gene44073-50246_t